ncbi:MAG: peptidylprolyl isomerase [Bacteroidetes bacterium]|nr:peptidylprolyl isomerase [Bacteroidota bacterium]
MKKFTFAAIVLLTAASTIISCKKKDDPEPPRFTISIGNDTIIKEGDSIIVSAESAGAIYLWSNGSTTSSIVIDTAGTFWVQVTKNGETASDTIKITLKYKLAFMETGFGNILIWLYPATPLHRNNFIRLTERHYYDSLIFHRVMDEFVIQGGDSLGTGYGGPGYTIPAEFRSYIKHDYGSVGAARVDDNVINPNKESNGSQFYIVDVEAGLPNLDMRYTVFGIVVNGMDAVEAISQVPVNNLNHRPYDNVYMKKVSIHFYTASELSSQFGFEIP